MCTVYSIQCTVQFITVYIIQCTVQYTIYKIQYTVYSLQYTGELCDIYRNAMVLVDIGYFEQYRNGRYPTGPAPTHNGLDTTKNTLMSLDIAQNIAGFFLLDIAQYWRYCTILPEI